jgi:ribose transport system permease protein
MKADGEAGWQVLGKVGTARGTVVPLLVFLGLVFGTSVIAPKILSWGALLSFLTDAAPLLFLVLGATLPILAGSIDLSVAGVTSLAGVLVVVLNPWFGMWTTPVVLVLAVLFGASQGWLLAWAQIPSFIMTLGTLSILSGLTLMLSHATAQPIPDNDVVIAFFGQTSFGVPNSILTVIAVAVALGLLMRFTRFGRDLFALGAGERTALMSGVNTVRVRSAAFAISSGCAALGGFLLVSITSFSSPTLAGNLLLLSIVGVVLGGTAISGGIGGLASALIGGLITAWLRVLTVLVGVAPTTQYIVFGVMALIAVALTTDRTKIGIIK